MFFREIEGWFDFHDIYQDMVNQAPKDRVSKFVEVGCWLGKSICFLGETARDSGKPIEIYAVDTWAGSNEEAHQDYIKKLGGPDELYNKFWSNMQRAGIDHIIKPIRKDSERASELFENESLDMVFIDASHEYMDVLRDNDMWLPKVKKNGILAGHDYPWPDVKKAVKERFPKHSTKGSSWIVQKG